MTQSVLRCTLVVAAAPDHSPHVLPVFGFGFPSHTSLREHVIRVTAQLPFLLKCTLLLHGLCFVPCRHHVSTLQIIAEFDLGHTIQLPRLPWATLIMKYTNKKATLGTVPGAPEVLNPCCRLMSYFLDCGLPRISCVEKLCRCSGTWFILSGARNSKRR